MEEVIVTATKRSERLNDVGAAISAYSENQIRQLGITSSTQISQQTIGVYFAEGPLSHLPLSNIRGVSQNDFTGNLETPNAVYVDQVYVSFQGASAFQLYDLERVEVVKGPQGTLFGRNATGGLIHYLSKEPTDDLDGYVQAGAGELGSLKLQGAVGGQIAPGLDGRLSVNYAHTDPYIPNSPGPDLRRQDDTGVRGQLLWKQDNFSDRLILGYGRQDHNFDYQHYATGFDPVSGLEFKLPGDQNPWGTCNGCDPGGFRDTDGVFRSTQEEPGLYKSTTRSATNILTWEINDKATLTSVTNLNQYRYFYQEDSDESPRFGLTGQRRGNYDQFSQEVRLNGTSGSLRWVGGLYYLARNTHDTADQNFGLAWFDDVLANLRAINHGDISSLGESDRLLSRFNLTTRSYAVFGQTEYEFSPKWTLITGLRYSYDRLKYNFVSRELIDGVEAPGVIGTVDFTEATAGDLAKNNKGEWSGQLALNFRPRQGLLTYVSVNRANKAGAWNAPFTGGPITPLKEEVLTSVEGGFKATLADGRAQLNGSVFHYFYKDYQGFIFQDFATQLRNLQAHVDGAEVELTLAPGGGWRLHGGVGYLDTYAKTNVPVAGGGTRASELPQSPRWNVNGSISKEWSIPGGTLTASADGVYTSSQYSDVVNTPVGQLPEKFLANARLAYLTDHDHLELAIQVRNLGDDKKPILVIPTHLGFAQVVTDRPTNVQVEATYRF